MGGVFLALLPLQAQTVARMDVGAIRCGWLKRSDTTVQTYCYTGPTGPGAVLVHNTIDTIDRAIEVRFNLGDDAIHWIFTQADEGIAYVALGGAGVPETLMKMAQHFSEPFVDGTDTPQVIIYNQPEGCSATGEWRPADQTQTGPNSWVVVFYQMRKAGVL
jgi:hypothetical protein